MLLLKNKVKQALKAIKSKYFGVFNFLFLLKKHKVKLIALTVISLITTALSTITPLITKKLIDDFYVNRDWSIFYWAAMVYGGIIIAGWLFGVISSYFSTYLNERFSFDLGISLQKKVSTSNFQFLKDRNTGEHIFRHTTDVTSIGDILVSFFPTIVLIASQILFFFIIAYNLSSRLTLLYISVLPILMILVVLKNKEIRPLQVKLRESNSNINDFHGQFHQGLATTKIFSKEKFEQVNLLNVLRIKVKQVFSLWRTDTVYSSLTLFSGSFWNMFILFYGWYLVGNGELQLGSLVALQLYLSRLIVPFKTGSQLINKLVKSSVSAERLMETFDSINEKDALSDKQNKVQGPVRISNLNFGYTQDHAILQDVNLIIEPSKVTGLTGASGAGKTTIVNLISKLYNGFTGDIYFDKECIKSINNNNLRNSISIVPQDPYLFSGSIADNIRYGKLAATKEELIESCKIANIHDYISKLDDGYDTLLGKNGISLSEGQKKRIGLARAMVKDSSILILDEFSASLDEITEEHILSNILESRPNVCVLLISHKVSNLLKCDSVFVLNNKTIVESGPPSDLIKNNGLFRKLYQLQYRFFNLDLSGEYDELEKISFKN